MPDAPSAVPPVFVGGTGRSGTTIAGEMIGAGAHYALVPIELRFHVDAGGLCALARRKVSIDAFEEAMHTRWYKRPRRPNGPRGVHVILDREGLDTAFDHLRSTYSADPWAATGAFLDEVIDPFRRRHQATTWVEMTPPNAKNMHALARMFPTARFLHMVRDGRDVASSVARRAWGPDDVSTAITWWGNQMMAIHRSTRNTDPARVHAVRLESLVGPNGAMVYDELVATLGLQQDEAMRAFLGTKMSVERARPGSWRRGLEETEQEHVEGLYQAQLRRLEAAGANLPPII